MMLFAGRRCVLAAGSGLWVTRQGYLLILRSIHPTCRPPCGSRATPRCACRNPPIWRMFTYTVSAATDAAVSASISTPVRPDVRTVAAISTAPSTTGQFQRHRADRQGMAERYQLRRALGRHDAGGGRNFQRVAPFFAPPAADQGRRRRLHHDAGTSRGGALSVTGLAPTSTIATWPRASKCENSSLVTPPLHRSAPWLELAGRTCLGEFSAARSRRGSRA